MREELLDQFSHFWRIYKSVINDFEPAHWKNSGWGLTQPNRLALHIIQSTKFYIEDHSPLKYRSGKTIEKNSWDLDKNDLPEKDDVLSLVDDAEKKTALWLQNIPFNSKNEKFPWTGKTYGSIILFLLRHGQYHLGEMNCLLNDQLKGKVEDYFVKENNV